MHNILCQNAPIFPLYILLTIRTDTLRSKDIKNFWFGGISTVWVQKSYKKINDIHKEF